ncbi:MAG TPA: carbamoyltransferase HypF [Solirubrobacteraceae bacterium]|nr:carbamoyltransferase HypF [Solirubrobacteraceae bacterium]
MSAAAARTASGRRRRVRARVEGTVQGVGFRPHVYRLATRLGVSGYVLNDASGVLVEAEGEAPVVEGFLAGLAAEAPALARIERVRAREMAPTGEPGFSIRPSPAGGEPRAPVTADSATCDECLAELHDPRDRRFRYPFINCTDCGPRFTIVRGVPYDRPLTTMAGFAMCAACRAEYEDPGDRRFHAQPNACPECGPRARLVDSAGRAAEAAEARDAVEAAGRALRAGAILAVKGIGGFHLACRADDEAAVAALRARKHREDKPFALMAADLEAAERLVDASPEDVRLLVSPRRPIVLAARGPDAPVAPSVAPRSPDLGVMLPYSPLHHLLLADAAYNLVMTSGNVSDEPIAYRDAEAMERLAGIADLLLVHDRPIQTRTDDSVLRTVTVGPRRPLVLRRSRGHVPDSVPLPVAARRPILACGAELKNTFCLVKGERAWVGHHIGDLRNYETLRSFAEGVEHFERLFAVAPEVVAHDLHPEYLSTKYAFDRDGLEPVGVQHHHAHLAACLAEHGETGQAVGAIYDGTGLGTDGAVWGGELLWGGLKDFRRQGSLLAVRLPGGDAAVRQPWRMACAWLVAAGDEDPRPPAALAGAVDPEAWAKVAALARTGLSSPPTTSMGRLFDAVAALCGLRAEVNYEGQAAIELEAACGPFEQVAYPLPVLEKEGGLVLDARPTIRALVDELSRDVSVPAAAARFHNAVATATAAACRLICRWRRTPTVVLSGGVFQNRRLLEATVARLAESGLRALVPELLPPNDGGIAYGQAAVAAARLARARDDGRAG